MGDVTYTINMVNEDTREATTPAVTGEELATAPGLAIRDDAPLGLWKVDHIKSGYLLSCFDYRLQAIAFAEWAASQVDFTRTEKAVHAEVKKKRLGKAVRSAAVFFRTFNKGESDELSKM